jgi:hypothetical protein
MYIRKGTISAALVLGVGMKATLLSGAASGAVFDGSANLLCAALDVVGCENGPGCWEGQARDFDLSQFILIDFENKLVRAKDEAGQKKVSPIKNLQKTDKQVIIQGVENDHGWSGTINRESGNVNFAAVGPDASFMLFGACTTLK